MPYTGSRKDAERRRLQAMTLLDEGLSQAQVACKLGVTRAAVCQWVRRRREGGDEVLKAKPHPGAKPKLNDRQLKRLKKLLLQDATRHGYLTELWTLPRIAELIRKHFGVTYCPSGVWHLMTRMQWPAQKPERRARQRDEQAIAQWRKKDWPRIKKSASRGKNHRVCR